MLFATSMLRPICRHVVGSAPKLKPIGRTSNYSSVNYASALAERVQRVLAAKAESGLSYDDLATKLGVTNTYCAQLLLGQAKLTQSTAHKLAEAIPSISALDLQAMQYDFPMRTFDSDILVRFSSVLNSVACSVWLEMCASSSKKTLSSSLTRPFDLVCIARYITDHRKNQMSIERTKLSRTTAKRSRRSLTNSVATESWVLLTFTVMLGQPPANMAKSGLSLPLMANSSLILSNELRITVPRVLVIERTEPCFLVLQSWNDRCFFARCVLRPVVGGALFHPGSNIVNPANVVNPVLQSLTYLSSHYIQQPVRGLPQNSTVFSISIHPTQ